MAEFRFHAIDPKSGVLRRGRLQASDMEQARRRLESQGFVVKALGPLGGETSQPWQGAFREPALERWFGWIRRNQKWMIWGWTLVGLALTFFYWDRTVPSARVRTYKPCKVLISGRLANRPLRRVEVRLPELPARFQFAPQPIWSQTGELKLEVVFEATRIPKKCQVTVEWDTGPPTQLAEIPLAGTPLAADLGPISPPR